MADSAVAIAVSPIVQEACNKSAAMAATMAIFPLSRIIFLMVTNKIPLMLSCNFTGSIWLIQATAFLGKKQTFCNYLTVRNSFKIRESRAFKD